MSITMELPGSRRVNKLRQSDRDANQKKKKKTASAGRSIKERKGNLEEKENFKEDSGWKEEDVVCLPYDTSSRHFRH